MKTETKYDLYHVQCYYCGQWGHRSELIKFGGHFNEYDTQIFYAHHECMDGDIRRGEE